MKIVFMGSADFGIPALGAIRQSEHTLGGVVTTPPRPRGRGLALAESPVARYAQKMTSVPVFAPESLKTPDMVSSLAALEADVFIVVAFRILPRAIFTIPRWGTVNIHASLLPRYRGAAPVQRAIEHGETETGITIFRIDEGIDTGDILLQKKTSIGPRETTPELCERLSEMGASAILESLSLLASGKGATVAQNAGESSRAPKLSKKEARIDWRLPAQAIFNKIRAFKPFPGTFTEIEGRKLGIEWAQPQPNPADEQSGTVCAVTPEWFEVSCGQGRLRVLSVKPEGKRSMDCRSFLCGMRIEKGIPLQ